MKQHFTYLSKDGITRIHGIAWKPEGKVKAVLQICHGMVEFIDRYDDFARYLTEFGFYVTGHDHLGHGQSVIDEAHLGYFAKEEGNACVIGDIHRLRRKTQTMYPDVPYFMLGHSMGSFLIRQYMELYGDGLAGVIVMGTGSQPAPVLTAARLLCRGLALIKGWEYRSLLVDNLAFASYNKAFEPARTPKDWLTKDTDIVDAYNANPLCNFHFTLNAYYNMFSGIAFIQKKENIRRIPKTLPIFLVAGQDDPVGNFGKGIEQVYEILKKHGLDDLQIRLYENDRHEILNELDREVVYLDLLEWMERHI